MRYDLFTHTDLTDEELIRLVQTGDELAFIVKSENKLTFYEIYARL